MSLASQAGPHLGPLVLEPHLHHPHAQARLRRQGLPHLGERRQGRTSAYGQNQSQGPISIPVCDGLVDMSFGVGFQANTARTYQQSHSFKHQGSD